MISVFKKMESEIILSKSSHNIQILTVIITLLMVTFIILACMLDYESYMKAVATVMLKDGDYYIKVPVTIDEISYYHNDDSVLIDGKRYPYQIIDISNDYEINESLKNYRFVTLKINLPKKYQINNYLMTIDKVKEKKKLIKYISDYFIGKE